MTVPIDRKNDNPSGIPDCKVHVLVCGFCDGQNELSRSTCIQCGMVIHPKACGCPPPKPTKRFFGLGVFRRK